MSTTITPVPDHAVVDVRPGDQEAATQVEEWLQDYATSRDPQLRERIILAYLGMADRLAGRFRDSRGTSPEDLIQTARAGLIAELASRAGISRGFLSATERGRHGANILALRRLARALDVRLPELVDIDGPLPLGVCARTAQTPACSS